MKLTEEQIDIINSNDDIKINAVAGSGKKLILWKYLERNMEKRINPRRQSWTMNLRRWLITMLLIVK